MRKSNPKRAEIRERINFGARLRMIRSSCGLRQDELAAKLKTYPAQISTWERSKHEPGVSAVVALAEAFGLSVGQIIGTEPITKEDMFNLYLNF